MPKLQQNGFIRFELGKIVDLLAYSRYWKNIQEAFEDLPEDPNKPENTLRYRRYSFGYFSTYLNELNWPPEVHGEICPYYQGDNNPEHLGETRMLPSISRETLANPLLRLIIENDFHRTSWSYQNLSLLKVGVHLVRLMVTKEFPVAVASPNCLHQDGEPYTFAHLVNRKGITGGANTIADPTAAGLTSDEISPGQKRASFTLNNGLESFAVNDALVSHAVDPIRIAPNCNVGIRDIVLIDFTVVKPDLLN